MANKAISELPQAQNVNNQDLFVLEQSGIAKKLPAETFITEQGIINALAEALDGHGGISSVTLSSVSGRIRTYLITFTDGSATTFQVLDGNTIDRIAKTSTAGLTDTYTVFMSDGTTTFFTVTNGADGTVSEEMLNDALKDKAPAVTETTESSAIANFTDGADNLVMHNIVAEINPVQSGSGDPSPSNIRPISGWTGCNVTRTGKNVYDISKINRLTYLGMTVERVEDRLHVYGTATTSSGFAFGDFHLMPGSYVYSSTSENLPMYLLKGYAQIGGTIPTVFDVSSASDTYRFRLQLVNGTTYDFYVSNVQIELGSTATTYETYQGNTVSLSWQTEAGTVYGGTIDVATGLLTVTHKSIKVSEMLNVSYETTNQRFNCQIVGMKKAPQRTLALVSSELRTQIGGGFDINWDNCIYNNNGSNYVVIHAHAYTDAAAMQTALADVQVVYPLATPQTYQLTPQQLMTLLGTNNVWADTGNVSVTYAADTKMFIEKLTQPTEDDMVANQAITSGKYFMVGNSLYLALANIASGAQITIGTNAQRVSLADALNTINA